MRSVKDTGVLDTWEEVPIGIHAESCTRVAEAVASGTDHCRYVITGRRRGKGILKPAVRLCEVVAAGVGWRFGVRCIHSHGAVETVVLDVSERLVDAVGGSPRFLSVDERVVVKVLASSKTGPPAGCCELLRKTSWAM